MHPYGIADRAGAWLNGGGMANTVVVSRSHLIFGLCLPLAVLLGYLLADPLESSSLAVVAIILGVLVIPLLMRWHHPLLIFAWNTTVILGFLPGRPPLWMPLALVSLLLAVLGRAVNPARKFLHVPAVTWPLGGLLTVVIITACLTGGFGLNAFGSELVGGKGYFFIMAAVAGYFALTSQPIPPPRARLYVALFFLSGLAAAASNLIYYAPSLYFLYYFFPPEMAYDQAMAYALGDYAGRISGMMMGAVAVNAFLLARYGLAGVFDLARPWRLGLVLLAGFASLYGGFRSAVLFQLVLFGLLFLIEGLWRTRYLFFALGAALGVGVALVAFVDRMPLPVQRAVSFLPVRVDPLTKQSADNSVAWRLEMWKTLWPEVPRYLFKGKGYALDPRQLSTIAELSRRGLDDSAAAAAFAGDYHNGPLSVVIPFGLYGAVAFCWLLAAGGWVLRRNHRYGDPALKTINAFLLAIYLTRVIFFFGVFGALYYDLYHFVGLVGLSVSLNAGVARPDREAVTTTS
jgi:hypothetical protein